jgi:hypothetical protein
MAHVCGTVKIEFLNIFDRMKILARKQRQADGLINRDSLLDIGFFWCQSAPE